MCTGYSLPTCRFIYDKYRIWIALIAFCLLANDSYEHGSVRQVAVTAVHLFSFLYLNQLDALISQIYFWNKILDVSDSSSVHQQEFFTVHTANLYDIYNSCVHSEKLVMMDRGTVRNMLSFIPLPPPPPQKSRN